MMSEESSSGECKEEEKDPSIAADENIVGDFAIAENSIPKGLKVQDAGRPSTEVIRTSLPTVDPSRLDKLLDLEDDGAVNQRSLSALGNTYGGQLRDSEDGHAMSGISRVWKRIKRFALCQKHDKYEAPSNQYRIPPKQEASWKCLRRCRPSENSFELWTLWLYRTTFTNTILVFLLLYFFMIAIFCLLIRLSVIMNYIRSGMECVIGFDFSDFAAPHNHEVLFELSWITFATVGYGDTSAPGDENCQGTRYLLSTEAFVGVLFTAFCGSVFYTKISRQHTRAHVTFSSAMCLRFVRFGEGERAADLKTSVSIEYDNSTTNCQNSKNFPVLEMRLVNDWPRSLGGEVIAAEIVCVVSLMARFENGLPDYDPGYSVDGILHGELHTVTKPKSNGKHEKVVISKRTFRNLAVTPSKHPYFSKGVWHFRHVIDGESPLLSNEARERIIRIGGWPPDFDTHEKIRECITENFQEIQVTFTGTSSLTAASVFKTQTYQLNDLYIGWKFASMVYISHASKQNEYGVDVDLNLLHDIVPQEGGGGEPMGERADLT